MDGNTLHAGFEHREGLVVRARRRIRWSAVLLPIVLQPLATASHAQAGAQEDGVGSKILQASNGARDIPDIRAWTSSALRNRVRVELKAPVDQVWAVIGDLARFPEFSSGLERVEVMRNARGKPTQYVCHFKPTREGEASVAHRELVRWYEPHRGYASSGEAGNAFGLTNDLNLVTVKETKAGTLVTWEVYFDAQDLAANKASYDTALADIADHLVRRFGGAVLERYVEPQPQ